MKPINLIAAFNPEGIVTPIKFQLPDGGEVITVKIDRIVDKSSERIAGNPMMVFSCESTIDDVLKTYELKYEVLTQKWYLSKI